MTPMIFTCSRLFKNTKINAITLFPFILLRKSELRKDKVLINHEKIHIRQQLELLIVFFYLAYVLEYVYRLILLKNQQKAYRAISFEREAYANEGDFSYLLHRKFWNFLKYR